MNRLLVLVVFVLLTHIGCEVASRLHTSPLDELIDVAVDTKTPMSYAGLSQVVAFHKQIISGAKPKGRAGFESLMKMDVSTIVCVDGVPPDVENAEKFGIKTVHIPLKYEAPSPKQILDLATIVHRERERGIVYIHCHQGKHRSAAAAAIVSIALGDLSVSESKEKMRVSQTSVVYQGLWDAVERTKLLPIEELLQNKTLFPSSVEPKGITSQMIAIDEAMTNLIWMQDAAWTAPVAHPDLIGAAEAGFITDTFRNMQLQKEVNLFSADFETLLINAMHHASSLEEALLQHVPEKTLRAYMRLVEQSCIKCHATYRR